jgi:hypothetical protein
VIGLYTAIGELMTVDEQLRQLAQDGGEAIIGPDSDSGQHLESFQGEVRRLRALADEGVIEIRREHQENMTGEGYVVRVHVRLTSSGKDLLEAMRSV